MLEDRAKGCLLGQLVGDAIGSLVEFQSPVQIRSKYPDGVRILEDGGTWDTLAGQPTDDSEMALLLARMLVEHKRYDADAARLAYEFWLASNPFDCGMTIAAGLRGSPNHDSQANGALMRNSPLGIFGANHPLDQVAEWARQDAALTHPHKVCQDVNRLFTMGISLAVKTGCQPESLYQNLLVWAQALQVEWMVLRALEQAAESPPENYTRQQGWVLIAFRNAVWQLTHAKNLEEAVVDTVMRGGDTDTNAAICGALLGAVHGMGAIPHQWIEKVLQCRPNAGFLNVRRPRSECFWPVDALNLAIGLLTSTS